MTENRTLALPFITVLAVAGCSEAQPDDGRYLFDLRHDEIEAALARYSPESEPSMVALQLEAPFDCAKFGDACARLGPERAESLLEEMWDLARDDSPEEMMRAAVAAQFTGSPAPVAAQISSTVGGLCIAPVWPLASIRVTASKSSFGFFSYAEVSYSATRQIGAGPVGPIGGSGPYAVDADVSLTVTTPAGTQLFASTTAVVAMASAAVGQLVFSPFVVVEGEVAADTCQVVVASI